MKHKQSMPARLDLTLQCQLINAFVWEGPLSTESLVALGVPARSQAIILVPDRSSATCSPVPST